MSIGAINNLSSVSSVYGGNTIGRKNETHARTGSRRDEANISTEAKDFKFALDAVRASSDIRQEKIDEIKSQISNGSYKININELANSIMQNAF